MLAFITGASRGLGREAAFFLADKGFDLALSASNEAALTELKQNLEEKHGISVTLFAADFSQEKNLQEYHEQLISSQLKVDLLINNVGYYNMDTIESMSDEILRKMLNINLFGAVRTSQALISQMIKNNKGHVFNIGSIATKQLRLDAASYTISKYALNGFTQLLREQLREHKIKVTEFIPGSINTSSWDGIEGVPRDEFIQCDEILNTLWNCYKNTGPSNLDEILIRPLNKDF